MKATVAAPPDAVLIANDRVRLKRDSAACASDGPTRDYALTPPGDAAHTEFLRIDGKVVDVCGGGPCYANGYTGP